MTRRRKLDEEIEAHRAEVAAEREGRNATIATKLREATDSRNLTRLMIAIAEGESPDFAIRGTVLAAGQTTETQRPVS